MDAGQPRRRSRRGSRAAAGIARRRPGRIGERTARALAMTLLLSVSVAGCATGWTLEAGRLVDARSGLSIAEPEGGPWRRIEVEGALLTLRRPDGATLSWLRYCHEAPLPTREGAHTLPRVLGVREAAHGLLRALAAREILEEGPDPDVGGATWRIRAAVRQDGRTARLDSFTRVADGCTEDWLLAVPETGGPVTASQREEERALLDHWWRSALGPQIAAQGMGTEPR